MRRAILSAVVLVLGAGLAHAEPDAGAGAELFQTHCAMCHGEAGDGKGPLAASLVVQPTDLTHLASRNGGTFPLLEVVRRIDGQDPLVAHGSPMPVFGPFFDGAASEALKTDSGQPVMMSQKIAGLVVWLQSIQAK